LISKIDVRVGSAIDSIEEMVKSKEESFDVIFIDADKTGYKKYYDTIMDAGLLRKGGVMLVDNVLYKVRRHI
jgi:caffeoyl-CoA O-methyltransferase